MKNNSKRIFVVELLGGLGNQLFQYAFGRSIALRHDAVLYLSTQRFRDYQLRKYELSEFNISEKIASNELLAQFESETSDERNFFKRAFQGFFGRVERPVWPRHKERQGFIFDPPILNVTDQRALFSGYWQCPQYFADIKNLLSAELTLKKPPTGKNAELIENFSKSKTASIHIRRGDYITNPAAAAFHGQCTLDYYLAAAEKVVDQVKPQQFAVFSDDIEWCQQNIKLPLPALFIGHNTGVRGAEDIRLMSHCRAHIIANSSFSWWGAWLAGSRSEIVIAPSRWTLKHEGLKLDIYPSGWTLL